MDVEQETRRASEELNAGYRGDHRQGIKAKKICAKTVERRSYRCDWHYFGRNVISVSSSGQWQCGQSNIGGRSRRSRIACRTAGRSRHLHHLPHRHRQRSAVAPGLLSIRRRIVFAQIASPVIGGANGGSPVRPRYARLARAVPTTGASQNSQSCGWSCTSIRTAKRISVTTGSHSRKLHFRSLCGSFACGGAFHKKGRLVDLFDPVVAPLIATI